MRKHFEGGSKVGVRDHIGSQLATVLRLGPTLLRFAIHRQHQNGMVGSEIGGGVVAAITVFAYRHYHIPAGVQRTTQLFESDAAQARRYGKVGVIGGHEADLG
jgi:hypothetical protein